MRQGNPEWRGPALGGHGRDDDGTQVIVYLWRRNDDARPSFLDLTTNRRIERNQPYVAAGYQTSSASPSLPNSPSTSESSADSAIFRAAAAHPARVGFAGLRNTNASRSMVISACPSSPICASNGFGITIPCELPIRRMATWVRFIVITMYHPSANISTVAYIFSGAATSYKFRSPGPRHSNPNRTVR